MSIKFIVDTNESSGTDKIIRSGILRFNEAATGSKAVKFNILATNHDALLGGAICYFDVDSVYIDVLWVDDSNRGKGLGSQIMKQIELEAVKRNASSCTLDTFDFQAEQFYLKCGYSRIGVITRYLGRHDRIFMRKQL